MSKRMKNDIYVGYKGNGVYEIFKSLNIPTMDSHGDLYSFVIGPFITMRGARYMRDYGFNNPHCTCVTAIEKLARYSARSK